MDHDDRVLHDWALLQCGPLCSVHVRILVIYGHWLDAACLFAHLARQTTNTKISSNYPPKRRSLDGEDLF